MEIIVRRSHKKHNVTESTSWVVLESSKEMTGWWRTKLSTNIHWRNAVIHERHVRHSREKWKEKDGYEGQREGLLGERGMRWGQRAVREEKKRGGTARAATAFRHVTFLFTSGCNTHAPHYWLSLTPFHRHIGSEGLWPACAAYARARNTSNNANNCP